ncbi:NAD(P)-binding protein [Xylona heveae TC161]|uniref:NAD(P)-binding protein n=1 Tax=Xylona heveae (strain CBS 132557 / TC161) TaxID=1328760 RepID=A0A165ILN3_XYLHT|nr:NAD(P)-binding protein [Xylona heveae TC161]KZF25074.1 NAD(P)-binding protein [Xylona heveae TC161]
MGNSFSQSFWIPAPVLTEKELRDQSGKVFIVTGGYAGVGFELTKILYSKNATVYAAGRTRDKALKAIERIKAAHPQSKGRVEFLSVDLGDLATIKPAAQEFLSKEKRLDVLWNNAGVMTPPVGRKSTQGHEVQMGTNCLGPFLFTQELVPILQKTAASSPPGTVRVTWAGSLVVDVLAPKGGVVLDDASGRPTVFNRPEVDYGQSKAGNVLLGSEFARRYEKDGIVSLSFNPGNLKTDLQREHNIVTRTIIEILITYHPIYGAYTELFAGLSDDLTLQNTGQYIIPWGRLGPIRQDIVPGLRSTSEGGKGVAEQFWAYCEQETRAFA